MSQLTSLSHLSDSLLPPSSLPGILDGWDKSASSPYEKASCQRASQRIYAVVSGEKKERLKLKAMSLQTIPLDLFRISILSQNLKTLELSNNHLKTLPHTICHLKALEELNLSSNAFDKTWYIEEGLDRLKDLNLSLNKIHYLHGSIGSLIALTTLQLNSNKLLQLPAEFATLTQLTHLNLDANKFRTFPTVLVSLQGLTRLDLGSNDFDALPSEIESWTALKTLRINHNNLTTLPSTISSLTTLTELSCHSNKFSVMPSEIGTLVSLEELNFSHNRLTAPSPTICSLTALKYLYLVQNPIRAFPLEINHLKSCTIELYGHALSQSVQTNLCYLCYLRYPRFSQGSSGPYFNREYSIEAFIQTLGRFTILSRGKTDLEELYKGDSEFKVRLHTWLFRLFEYASFQSEDTRKGKLAQRMFNLLKLATEDPQFRAVFRSVVIASVQAKDTRIALSLLDIEVQYQLALCDKRDLPSLSRLLARGVFVPEILKSIIQEKKDQFSFVDETDLYFGYHSLLWERLELLEIDDLRHLAYTYLSEEELHAAVERVESTLGNEDALHGFLMTQEVWIEALKRIDPEGFKALEGEPEEARIAWSQKLLQASLT